MKIKLSKNQWQFIGQKTGWGKTNKTNKIAMNDVNTGADSNNGMQAAPTDLTNQQEAELAKYDFAADIDAQKGFTNFQNWKKSLTPKMKTLLPKDIVKLKTLFPSLNQMLKNPNVKLTQEALLEQMSKSDPNKITQFKTMLEQIQTLRAREEASAARPYMVPGTVPQQSINNVQQTNNPGR